MIYPRLKLLRQFLRQDGVIFIFLDDNEIHSLDFIADEIFGRRNWLGTICWKNATDNNPTRVAIEHEYIPVFCRNLDFVDGHWKSAESPVRDAIETKARELIRKFPDRADREARQRAYSTWFREHKPHLWPFQEYDQIDEVNVFTGSRSVHNPGKEGYFYDIVHPNGKVTKKPLMGYRFPEITAREMEAGKRFIFGDNENKIVEIKVYINEWKSKLSSIYDLDGRRGSNEVRSILHEGKRAFSTAPKPMELVGDLISFVAKTEDLVLDSFAGTGTTGHAVLDLNKQDGGNRRFILVEMEEKIAQDVTAERLRRVINGYDKGGDPQKPVDGLGGGFRFCTLGTPLFNEFGDIDAGVTFPDLAAHIFFAETGSPLPKKVDGSTPLLGTHRGTAVYLLFSPAEQGFAREAAGNVLTPEALDRLPAPSNAFGGTRVVYAEGCTVAADRLKAQDTVFKQIPYQVEGI